MLTVDRALSVSTLSSLKAGFNWQQSIRMYQIKDITTEEIKSSNYIHPLAVHYTQVTNII